MNEPKVNAAKTILERWKVMDTPKDIFFINPHTGVQFRMDRNQWVTMGFPDAITLTIEVGDTRQQVPAGYRTI